MTIKTSDQTAQFEHAVRSALRVLGHVHQLLKRLRPGVDSLDDELELLHLSSLVTLAQQRGRHLVDGGDVPLETPADRNLPALLVSIHDELITVMPTPASFLTLQFVSEIGALVQGVTRHVERP